MSLQREIPRLNRQRTQSMVIVLLIILSAAQICSANVLTFSGNTGNAPRRIWFENNTGFEKTDVDELLASSGFKEPLDIGELRFKQHFTTPGGEVYQYAQFYRDIPVIGGGVVLKTNRSGQPVSLFNSTAVWTTNRTPLYITTRGTAVEIACKRIDAAKLRSGITVEKVVLAVEGAPVFSWLVRIPAAQPPADWEVFVRASDGEIILTENVLKHLSGTGWVFNPDPVTALHDPSLEDEDDAADAIPFEAYLEVELINITEDDEQYLLTGDWIDTSPTEDRVRMDQPYFLFERNLPYFEEVMAYYHIDTRARYLETLGYGDILPSPQPIDVNGIEADESFFSPFSGIITTGTGGVDDAEDADVLMHEYGHAVMHRILPYWRGGETLVLSEGWCDYQAGDYSLNIDDQFQPMTLFNWDGHNEFWDGRILNSDYTYPEIQELSPHDAGQMWSSLLTEVRQAHDEVNLWNMVVIDHLFALGDSAMITDAAQALLTSDLELAEGEFRPSLVQAFETREIFPPGLYSPSIDHRPLTDVEDLEVERLMTAHIESPFGINPELSLVIVQHNDADPDTVQLEYIEDEDLYQALLTAPHEIAQVHYYICATDTLGVCTTDPPGAPVNRHRYFAGPDHIPPLIVDIDTLHNSVFPEGEINFTARVTDNLSLAEVSLLWYRNQGEPAGITLLNRDEQDSTLYTGRFRWQADDGESIQYAVLAVDDAREQNVSLTPRLTFDIRRDALLEGFETANHRWNMEGWKRTDRISRQGDWSVVDRDLDTPHNERISVIELNESWNLERFGRFRLNFCEAHRFDEQVNEFGVLEISSDSGMTWDTVLELTGDQPFWALREVNLDGYCGVGLPPVEIRFLSYTPENALPMDGWFIDSLALSTEIIVSAEREIVYLPTVPFISAPFPNPTNGSFRFNYNIAQAERLILLDITGRKVMSLPIPTGSNTLSIDMNPLPNGVYYVTLEGESAVRCRRIVFLK